MVCLGWTTPGRFKAQVESLKFMTTMANATLPRMAIAEFLQSGGDDRYLRKIRKAFAEQESTWSHSWPREPACPLLLR
jgi:DNA-binding transcriptional MocR family regulator